MTKN
jgi:hypothetical protein